MELHAFSKSFHAPEVQNVWYAIFGTDTDNSLDQRLQTRTAHLNRLQLLRDEGRLLLAGPHPATDNEEPGPAGFTGSLIIAKFDNLQEAEAWANLDPYLSAGVYKNVDVKPFKQVLP